MEYDSILEVYSLEEILEMNDLTTEEVLQFLVEQKIVEVPDPRPLDFND